MPVALDLVAAAERIRNAAGAYHLLAAEGCLDPVDAARFERDVEWIAATADQAAELVHHALTADTTCGDPSCLECERRFRRRIGPCPDGERHQAHAVAVGVDALAVLDVLERWAHDPTPDGMWWTVTTGDRPPDHVLAALDHLERLLDDLADTAAKADRDATAARQAERHALLRRVEERRRLRPTVLTSALPAALTAPQEPLSARRCRRADRAACTARTAVASPITAHGPPAATAHRDGVPASTLTT